MGEDNKVFIKLARMHLGNSYKWLIAATSLYVINVTCSFIINYFMGSRIHSVLQETLNNKTSVGTVPEVSPQAVSTGLEIMSYGMILGIIGILIIVFYIVAYVKKRGASNALLMSQLNSDAKADYILLESHASGIGRWMGFFILIVISLSFLSSIWAFSYTHPLVNGLFWIVYGLLGLIFWMMRRARFYANKPFFESSIPASLN